MKPKTFKTSRWILALLAIGTTLVLVSWDFKQPGSRYQADITDTIPGKIQEKKIRDLDDVLDELNKADRPVNMEKVQREITEALKQVDGARIKLQVEKAMKEVDMAKIEKEINESMAKIDMVKMQKEMQQAMKEIDGEKIKMEIENSMKDIDFQKIQKETQESVEKINWDKMKVEMDKIKNIDMSKLDADMKKLGPQIEKEMANAKAEIEKAKGEMKEYKDFVDGLEKDGLLNKKEAYTIKHKDGELVVNGKKVSIEIYSKYRVFLEKHKKFTIEKSKDDFNIDVD